MGWLEDMLGVPSKPTLGVGALQNPLAALQAQPGPAPQASLGAGAPPLGVGGGADFEAQARSNAALAANATSRQQAAETGMQAELAEKTALAEAQRANRERVAEERRTALYADIDRQQKDILAEAARAPAIDPGKGVRDMGAVGAIGTIASGFLSGLINPKGGANDIVQLVTQIADRSVQTQVANQEQRNKLLGLRQQALGGDLARGRDLIDAELVATVRAYDSAARTFAAEAQKKWGGEIGAAKSQAIISGIRDGLLLRVQGWRDKKQELGIAGMNAQTARIGAQTGQAAQEETARHNQAEEGLSAAELGVKAAAAKAQPVPGGQEDPRAIHAVSNEINGPVRASRPEAADKLNERIGAGATLLRLIDRNAEIRRQIDGGGLGLLPDSEKDLRSEAESNYETIVNVMSSTEGQGVVRKEDHEAAEARVGDPAAWYDTGARLEATRTYAVNAINDQIEAMSGAKLRRRWGERAPSFIPGDTRASSRLMGGEPGLNGLEASKKVPPTEIPKGIEF